MYVLVVLLIPTLARPPVSMGSNVGIEPQLVESQQVVLAKPNSQVLEKTEMTRRRCGRYASLLHDAIVFMVAETRKTRASQGFTAGAFSSKSGHRFLVSKMRQIQHFDHFQGLTILENDRGG